MKRLRLLATFMKQQFTVLIFFFLLAGAARAETVIRSTAVQTNLIELYTSEGCSSCPPADKWLSGLTQHPELWRSLIPMAFHVDYWDYIGWEDRYAKPQYADRQRQYAHENSMPTIYTPGLMSNGEEWRNFMWKAPDSKSDRDAGKLSGIVTEDRLAISYRPPADAGLDKLTVSVALLGFGLTSEVRAGENSGRKLNHDFVVLEHFTVALKVEDGLYRALTRRPESTTGAEKYALTLWVSEKGKQAPLQAAGGWLET